MAEENFENSKMEEFFDNLLDEKQRARFLDEMEGDESFDRKRELQARIDQALLRRFDLSITNIDGAFLPDEVESPSLSASLWSRRNLLLSLAAVLCGLLIYGVIGLLSDDRSPHFQIQPLAELYNQELDRGFKPYYECRDMQRFSKTFEHRLGVPLTLAQMPDDRKMLGISYLGGTSRMTISMLCEVKGMPVIVFVDVDETHNPDVTQLADDSKVSIFTIQRDGVVFYEVTPHRSPNMIDYFEFTDIE